MSVRRTRSGDVNQGIQGNVTANVVAVGQGAQAVSIGRDATQDQAALRQAVDDLRRAIDALQLPATAKQAVTEDVAKLERSAQAPQASKTEAAGALASLAGKLKMVGLVLTETAGLAEPAKKIMEVLRLSAAGLGLG
jgi:hypothetical protein